MGLIRLGEEVSRIPEGVRAPFPGQPWRVIVEMRNMAAHQYDALTARRVWKPLLEDIPVLRAYVGQERIPTLRHEAADGFGAA